MPISSDKKLDRNLKPTPNQASYLISSRKPLSCNPAPLTQTTTSGAISSVDNGKLDDITTLSCNLAHVKTLV